ncbi:hypothetical protein [Actinomadura rubrisoli]|uniref:DUF4352 domain-containing protein n=1 Tax=Actinomadura rubrisoli TaxID=2530368 RepID=A0A4R5ASV3_9ACTN|nr:hypothetical protein [Actinomadura rubrisoli]TDD75385.1 hypothetical protein E1298_31650 [Actinomadura rubrisoli]
MSDRGSRPPKRLVATGAALALALALAGCGGGGDKSSGKPKPPPPPSTQPESAANAAPGALDLKSSSGLRKPVTYNDKITVKVGGIRYVKTKADGPGKIAGRVLTIFTLSFTNGSAKPLDLNQVRVVAKYGPRRAEAKPTSYANINDFYGSVAPGASKRASYAFDIPTSGYKQVALGVKFDARHKAALFVGALHP